MTGVLLGALIGVLGGMGALLFRSLIAGMQGLFLGTTSADHALTDFQVLPWWRTLLSPALGGAIVGPLVWYLAREAKGHGVPEVMEAVAIRGGRIRKRVVVIKAFASAVCIGSGGSVGREGPIVQIGSAIGSALGQVFRVSTARMRTLVGCGAAAGIAATFNAPIAGAMFALEVIVGEYGLTTFTPIVVSSVMATVISRAWLGNTPAFIDIEPYQLQSALEIPFYAGLGLFAAVVAVIFTRLLYLSEDGFDKLRFIPPPARAAVGGLLLGIIALKLPQVFGNGYDSIAMALNNDLGGKMLLLLIAVKIIGTSITLGTGGSGGVFAPSLFIGAMTGGAFGVVVQRVLGPESGLVANPGAYALVGMGAVVAGTTQAPISAILILFEMTGDYRIILPLMLACVISSLASHHLLQGSIYTIKLLRRGLNLRAGRDIDLLRSIPVKDVMMRDVATVTAKMPIHDVVEHIHETEHLTFPVVDDDGLLVGIISHHDYQEALRDESLQTLVLVGEVATEAVITVTPETNLSQALRLIGNKDIETVPVVEGPDSRKLVGILTRRDILHAYQKALAQRTLTGP